MVIHLFRPKFNIEESLDRIRDCLEVGWTGAGYKTDEFESAWRKSMGFKNAFFVNSCTAALDLAVRCLKERYGWQDGDEIITTPNTFVSTNHMILKNRLHPVFADIDDTLCLAPNSVIDRISEKTRAVMFVGIGGNPGNYSQIVDICRQRNLKLILDAAHMSGTRLDGEPVGHEADAVCFSFHAVKNLPTADGGMLCFADAGLDADARVKAWLGIDSSTYERTKMEVAKYKWKYNVRSLGEKYSGNAVMAALAISQLASLEGGNDRRRSIARMYDQGLADVVNQGLVRLVRKPENCESSTHLYQIIVDDRNGLHDELEKQGIETGVHYISNTRYEMYRYAQGSCPNAEYISDHVLSLPMHLELTDTDVRTVIKALIAVLTKEKNA